MVPLDRHTSQNFTVVLAYAVFLVAIEFKFDLVGKLSFLEIVFLPSFIWIGSGRGCWYWCNQSALMLLNVFKCMYVFVARIPTSLKEKLFIWAKKITSHLSGPF